jgi:hypothetical protein
MDGGGGGHTGGGGHPDCAIGGGVTGVIPVVLRAAGPVCGSGNS